ncbi:MAG: DUF3106 domain-containing protein, partial [Bryobacteraceae bacterium]
MRLAHAVLAVTMLAVYVSPAAAQNGVVKQKQKQRKAVPAAPLPAPALERFLLMSPEQQQRALLQLDPARRQQFKKRLRWFEQLPADTQDQLRTRYEAFLALPQARRQAVRQELQRLRVLSPSA